MKKTFLITALGLMLGLGLASCNNVSLKGTWIESVDENSTADESGFTLNDDGTVTSINTGYIEYKTWEKVDDQLVLRGNINGSTVEPFVDTLWIDELTEERLVLKDFGNYSVAYQRKTE